MLKQVASIFALNNGLLEGVDLDRVSEWEESLYTSFASKSSLLESLTKGFDDQIKSDLKQAIVESNDILTCN